MSNLLDVSKIVTRIELDKLLDYQEKNFVKIKAYLRDYTILLLLGDAGLRVGELSLLLVEDVVSCGSIARSLRIRKEIAKYRIERIVPLSRRLQESLSHYVNELIFGSYDLHGFLFPGRRPSSHLSTKQIQNIVSKLSTLALGRSVYPHMLRHGFATYLMKTTPLPVVQRLLGHRNLSSTQVYCHPDEKDLFDAIDTL